MTCDLESSETLSNYLERILNWSQLCVFSLEFGQGPVKGIVCRSDLAKWLSIWPCRPPTITFPHCFRTIFSLPCVSSNFAAWIRTQFWGRIDGLNGSPPLTKWKYAHTTTTWNAMCAYAFNCIYLLYNIELNAHKSLWKKDVLLLLHPQPSSWYLSSNIYCILWHQCATQDISGMLSVVHAFMGISTLWPRK